MGRDGRFGEGLASIGRRGEAIFVRLLGVERIWIRRFKETVPAEESLCVGSEDLHLVCLSSNCKRQERKNQRGHLGNSTISPFTPYSYRKTSHPPPP